MGHARLLCQCFVSGFPEARGSASPGLLRLLHTSIRGWEMALLFVFVLFLLVLLAVWWSTAKSRSRSSGRRSGSRPGTHRRSPHSSPMPRPSPPLPAVRSAHRWPVPSAPVPTGPVAMPPLEPGVPPPASATRYSPIRGSAARQIPVPPTSSPMAPAPRAAMPDPRVSPGRVQPRVTGAALPARGIGPGAAGDAAWVPAGQFVRVGGCSISGGLVYVATPRTDTKLGPLWARGSGPWPVTWRGPVRCPAGVRGWFPGLWAARRAVCCGRRQLLGRGGW